jgi:hypothetical protein
MRTMRNLIAGLIYRVRERYLAPSAIDGVGGSSWCSQSRAPATRD